MRLRHVHGPADADDYGWRREFAHPVPGAERREYQARNCQTFLTPLGSVKLVEQFLVAVHERYP